jgi:hypothetical protein
VEAEGAADPLLGPDEQLERSLDRERMAEALASLPEKHRAPLVMYEIEGLSLRQMAERLSVSVAVASARLQAGRRALARAMRRKLMVESARPDSRRRSVVLAFAAAAAIVAVAVRPQESPRAASAEAAPLGEWRFDDAPGSVVARDSSGNDNHCVLRGPGSERGVASTAGVHGRALGLAGAQWLECPRAETLARLDEELTVAAWVRPRFANDMRAVVARQQGNQSRDELLLGFVGPLVFFRSHRWAERLYHRVPLTSERWIHVAATVDAEGTGRLFVDGVVVEEGRADRPPTSGGRHPLIIGGAINGSDPRRGIELFEGLIDEVRLFDRALTPAEIARLATR